MKLKLFDIISQPFTLSMLQRMLRTVLGPPPRDGQAQDLQKVQNWARQTERSARAEEI